MLKLAMLLDNAGEPVPETRYRDPRHLRQLGYTGLVLWETTGLSGVDTPASVGSGEMRRWVDRQFEIVRERIQQARAAGLDVYLTYDALTLPREVVDRSPSQLVCKHRSTMLCPASEPAMQLAVRSLEGMLSQLPEITGVVLRFGDSVASRLPYLIGNDIYIPHCPRCSQLGRVDRVSMVLEHYHQLVVGKLNKRLIARAWNVRPQGMHDSVEMCQRLAGRLPGEAGDDRFVLSFKFTETDFWRYQKWNPASLVFGKRPIIYELQCQREFEGKGGIPNWQVPLWRDGYPEMHVEGEISGLAQAAKHINLAGLWAWVRGGGWGGPFIKNESWIDANVVSVPRLADQPDADPVKLAQSWIHDRLGVSEPEAAQVIGQVLEHSPQVVLQGMYVGPFARRKANPWHPNGDLIQDDLLDAQTAWRMVQQLPDGDLDELVHEKQQAVQTITSDIAALQHQINARNRGTIEPLLHTLIYTESLLQTLRDLFAGLIAYRRYQKSKDAEAAQTARHRLLAAQSNWNHHVQRHGSMPGVATAFREANFWELTQRILDEVA